MIDRYDYSVRLIVRDRAKARREREAARGREDAPRAWVPFPEYLEYVMGILDWRDMKPYARYQAFLDYELDCLKMGLEYDHPSVYGLHDTLMK